MSVKGASFSYIHLRWSLATWKAFYSSELYLLWKIWPISVKRWKPVWIHACLWPIKLGKTYRLLYVVLLMQGEYSPTILKIISCPMKSSPTGPYTFLKQAYRLYQMIVNLESHCMARKKCICTYIHFSATYLHCGAKKAYGTLSWSYFHNHGIPHRETSKKINQYTKLNFVP